jgi:hypothetical protein
MKNLSFYMLLTLLLLTAACGDKDKSKSKNSFSSDQFKVSTVVGYINPQQPDTFEANGKIYQFSQYSQQTLYSALNLAQQQRIQPVQVNGQWKYRARVSGSLMNMNYPQGGMQAGFQPQPNLPAMGNTVNVTQAVIY